MKIFHISIRNYLLKFFKFRIANVKLDPKFSDKLKQLIYRKNGTSYYTSFVLYSNEFKLLLNYFISQTEFASTSVFSFFAIFQYKFASICSKTNRKFSTLFTNYHLNPSILPGQHFYNPTVVLAGLPQSFCEQNDISFTLKQFRSKKFTPTCLSFNVDNKFDFSFDQSSVGSFSSILFK